MVQTIGILGLGIFGSTVAKELGRNNYDVIAIDKDEKNINRIEPFVSQAIIGDFTQFDLLRQVGIDQCDRVLIASGRSLEASALAIIHLKKLGVSDIIAKSKNHDYMDVMKELGVTRVIRPEYEMGVRTAKRMMQDNIIDLVKLDGNLSIIEFLIPKSWKGKTIAQLQLRQKFDFNVIGIKENYHAAAHYQVDVNHVLTDQNILIIIADFDKFNAIKDLTNGKVFK